MNIKYFQIVALCILFVSCSSTIENEFGKSCQLINFNYEKRLFSSDISGGIKFQFDESSLKDSGKMITGALPAVSSGSFSLTLAGGMNENCDDCILLFVRDKENGNRSYKAVSGTMNMETLYFDTKGRVSFAKGYFSRMVFENIEGTDCIVETKIDFVFY